MKTRSKYLVGFALALSLLAGAAVLKQDNAEADTAATSLAGVAAGMHFTDADGNPRLPTAAEQAALAEAFQADLADLMKGKRLPKGSQQQPNGSVSAVVGTQKMRFLTVEIDESGNASFGHSRMDDEGRVEPAAAEDWPEM